MAIEFREIPFALFALGLALWGLPAERASAASPNIVIAEIYGGGGLTGATYKNDYIVLFNRDVSPVNVNGWSVQYGAAGSLSWQMTSLPNVFIQPGGYFLIQGASGGTVGATLPPADAVGTLNLSATAGKVALVNNNVLLRGACPLEPSVVDVVGYGTTANCFEGSGRAPAPSNSTAAQRRGNGCTDTDDNANDFLAAVSAPRNSATAPDPCNQPTPPSGVGSAYPAAVGSGETTVLKVMVTPGSFPPSTLPFVSADLTAIGGPAFVQFFDDGTDGDEIPNDKVFSFATFVFPSEPGNKIVPFTVSDLEGRFSRGTLTLPVIIDTQIAFLRQQQDTVNWRPTDTTNIYRVVGTVISHVNLTTPANALFYIQDRSGGIAVFVNGGTNRPAAGDLVRVTGPLGHFNGLLQLNLTAANPAHSVVTFSTGNPLPEPTGLNFSDSNNIPYMEFQLEGRRATVSNVLLDLSTPNFPTNGGDVLMTNSAGELFNLRIDARVTDLAGTPKPTTAVTIKGVIAQFDTTDPRTSGYQLLPTRRADLLARVEQYTLPIVPGFNPIANQLDRGGNTLNEVLPSVPRESYLMKWDEPNQNYLFSFYDDILQQWQPNLSLQPGEGALFHSTFSATLNFVGALHTPGLPLPLPHGVYRFLSRQNVGPGAYENIIGTPPEEGAKVYRYNVMAQSKPGDFSTWDQYQYSQGVWTPSAPNAVVGEPMMFYIPAGAAPQITVQPQDLTVVNCQDASFQVRADSSTPPSYQWRFNTLDLLDATNSVLTILGVQPSSQGDYTVVVRNDFGAVTSQVARLTVVDLPPTIASVPPNQTLSANAGCQAVVPSLVNSVVAKDNCGAVTVMQSPLPGSLIGMGDTLVTFTARDDAGNASTGTTLLTVTDDTPPYLPSCPELPARVVDGGREGFQTPNPTQPRPTLSALVSGPSRMFDEFGTHRPLIHSFIELPECVANCTLSLHVRADVGTPQDDTITVGFADPTGFNPLSSWTRPFGPGPLGPGLTQLPWGTGADVELTLDLGHLPTGEGAYQDLLPELAKHRYLDILISDSTAVDFIVLNYKTCSAGPDIVVPNLPGQAGAPVPFPLPEFADNCTASPVVTASPASGSFFPLGRTVVFFKAQDAAGNVGRAKRWVEVRDVEPPFIACTNIVVDCTKPSIPVFFHPQVRDNSGQVVVQCSPPSGSIFNLGTTTVECLAVDPSGNTSQCSFLVAVRGRLAPPIRSSSLGLTHFALTFDTQLGFRYAVESQDRVVESAWTTLTNVTGTGFPMTFVEPVAGHSSRFYRVALLNPPVTTDVSSLFEPPEPPPAQPGTGEPCRQTCGPPYVYLFSGEFHYETVDLCIKGRGLDFVWARKFRSCPCLQTPMGWGWDYSYNICIVRRGPDLDLFDGNTRQDTLHAQPDGTYVADEFFRQGRFATNGQFILTFADTGAWEFLPLNGLPAQGRIARIRDRNGNALRFTYDLMGRLTNITDTLDRDIVVSYDADGYIESVTDFAGRRVRYEHYHDGDAGGSLGDLRAAIMPPVFDPVNGNNFPGGKTNIYTYDLLGCCGNPGHQMLTITDGKGQTWLSNTYEPPGDGYCNRVVRQMWGYSNEVLTFHYVAQTPSVSNNFAVTKAIVNDRVGNVSECYFDAGNRPVLHRAFTGRAVPGVTTTDTANRPQNRLRPTDPAYFDTRYWWNADSMLTRVLYPNGNWTENVYELDLDPGAARRSRGNLRICRKLPGPLGGDQPVIEERFHYEAGLGGGCCDFNFVTRHIDGRGNVTLHAYDARGNRLHTQNRLPAITEDFEYNEFGQLTAHTLPDNGSAYRRRDEFAYYASGPARGYRAQEIVDARGLRLTKTLEYDLVGNVIRTVDPRGHDTQLNINALNQVLRETSREVADDSGIRYRRDFYYDANNNMVRIDTENRNESGVLQTNTHYSEVFDYDILNYVTRVAREKGSADLPKGVLGYEAIPFRFHSEFIVNEYAYDANRNRTLARYGETTAGFDPYNLVRSEYDERDLIFREIHAEGSALQFTAQHDYDGNKNRVRLSRGLEDTPRVTSQTYDGFNRQTRQTDPMGNVKTFHYDANCNLVAERLDGEMQDLIGDAGNRRLAETWQAFDAMDRLARVDKAFFDPQSQQEIGDGYASTWFVFSGNSQLVRVVDDRTNNTFILYDTATRTNAVVDAKNNRVSFEYDANGNVLVRRAVELSDLGTPPREFATTNIYDGLDRLIQSADAASQINRYAYDSRNNLVANTDLRGNVTRQTFDGLSRLIETQRLLTDTGYGSGSPAGAIVTRQEWDDSCRLISQTDANQHTTRYAYDALDRRIATGLADGTMHLVGNGVITWPADQARPKFDEFFSNGYDVHGNAVSVSDANGTVMVTVYDLLDRPIQRYMERAAGVLGATFEIFQHDGRSLLLVAQNDDTRVARAYDSLGHLLRETINFAPPTFAAANDHLTSWTRDALGNAIACTYPGGRLVGRSFDALNRVERVCNGVCPDPPVPGSALAQFQYLGPDRIETLRFGNGTGALFAYDAAGRASLLTYSNIASGEILDRRLFNWEAGANRIQRRDLTPGSPGMIYAYSYDSVDRLAHTQVSTGGGTLLRDTLYGWDGAGNRTHVNTDPAPGNYTQSATAPEPVDAQVNQYTSTPFDSGRLYDLNGNLKSITGVGGVTTNNYDYRNRLVVANPPGVSPAFYLYDALGRILTKVTGAATRRYFYDGENMIEEQDANGGTIVTYIQGLQNSKLVSFRRGNEEYFVHRDDLGNVMALSDSTGAVVERYNYEDFGEPLISVHAQTPYGGGGYLSDADAGYTVADDFTLALAAVVHGVRWWGFHVSGAPPSTDNFVLRIYSDAANQPGALLHLTSSGNLVFRTATGRTLLGGVTEFVYEAALSTPFVAQPGVTYWLVVQNNTGASAAKWSLEAASHGNFIRYESSNGGGTWNPGVGDAAFELVADRSAVGNPYLFFGSRYDAETGIFEIETRQFDPVIGRYIDRDPYGIWNAPVNLGNGYSFLGNNPWKSRTLTSFVDLYDAKLSQCCGGQPITSFCAGNRIDPPPLPRLFDAWGVECLDAGYSALDKECTALTSCRERYTSSKSTRFTRPCGLFPSSSARK